MLRDFAARREIAGKGAASEILREGQRTWGKALCCQDEGQSNRSPANAGWKLGMIFENLTSLFLLEGNFQILDCHGVEEVPQSPEKVKKKLGPPRGRRETSRL